MSSRNWHPQGKFRRVEDRWLVALPSGQGREPRSGDQATVHLASGGLKRVTLTERRPSVLLGQHGKVLYIYDFKDGWS